jgi:site-specific recombinase XerD
VDDLGEWQDEWELVLTHERHVADLTRTTYLRAVRQFREFIATADPDVTSPEQITARHIGAFLSAMADAGRSENTRRIRLKSLRLWFNYLIAQPDSGVAKNPALAVDLPEEKLPPVPVIPDEDLLKLLRVMGGVSYVDRRDTAIVRLLLDCGMRRGELVGIDVDDVDLRHQEITLHRTKGGKARVVPFAGKTALALRKYQRARERHAAARSPALFLSIRSDRAGQWRMTGGGMAEMITRRCNQAGLAAIHPHQFRHTWADDMLSNGANEGDVERLAGWTSPLMVRRYGRSAADRRARDSARRLARGDRV